MAREIKFREWDKQRGTISYGEREDFDDIVGFRFKHTENIDGDLSKERVLEQYTGLKDKNSVEVYEGDVVQYRDNKRDIYEVKFGEFGVPDVESERYIDSAVGFYLVVIGKLKNVAPFNMTIPLNEHYANSYAVIGNIHENPELLEE